jgi:hypothetical protein
MYYQDRNNFSLDKDSISLGSGFPAPSTVSRLMVRLIFFVYFLLILEGALRKWFLPEYSQYLFFIRDPFVVVIYVLALANGRWPSREPWLSSGLLFGVFSLLLAVLQLALGVGGEFHSILVVSYGLRNYFFYIPLAFIIAANFQRRDIDFIKNVTFFFVAISSILVLMQFYSPMISPINIGNSEDVALQFHGLNQTGDHTRPMGFFTSAVGQKQLVVSSFAFMIAEWAEGGRRGAVDQILLLLGSVGTAICIAYSGSRTAVLHSGLIVLVVFGSILLGRYRGGLKVIYSMLGVFIVGGILGFFFLGDGVNAFLERWTAAQSAESQIGGVFGRAFYSFIDFFRLMTGTPLLGFGLGMGGNAAITLSAGTGGLGFSAETDWARHIVELGPFVGLIFIVYRVGLTFWLTKQVLRSVTILGFSLYGYVFYLILADQVTGHGSLNGFAWIFLGLAVAAMKNPEQSSKEEHPSISENNFPNLMR